VGLVAVVTVVLMVAPGPVQGVPGLVNPIGLTDVPGLTPLAGLLIAFLAVGATAAATATLIVRLVRARNEQRTRLAWVLPAQVLVVGAVLFSGDLPYPWNDVATAAALTGLVASLVVVDTVGAALDDRDASRRALVAAREAERARLRRDLHDGLGPEIAGLSLQLSVAAGKAHDPGVRAVLSAVQERLRVTATQVRHLVDGLRPPALDELGLTGAVRQLVTRQAGAFPDGVTVTGEDAASFPPEVEVAAHHIIAEAFTNAARHSGASRCEIRIVGDGGALLVQVADDGPARAWSPDGVGMESMRARAREIGGHLRIVRRTDGTTVHATLPLAGEASG
jgi:signal transduction histidine kinase